MWLPVLEMLPAPAWFGTGAKLGYIASSGSSRPCSANVFFWSGAVFYAATPRAAALGALAAHDQGLAGAIMMIEGSLVTIAALAWLFLRLARRESCARSCSSAGSTRARSPRGALRARRRSWRERR